MDIGSMKCPTCKASMVVDVETQDTAASTAAPPPADADAQPAASTAAPPPAADETLPDRQPNYICDDGEAPTGMALEGDEPPCPAIACVKCRQTSPFEKA
eukprot:3535537-Pyramimonas_sp.AAC.1